MLTFTKYHMNNYLKFSFLVTLFFIANLVNAQVTIGGSISTEDGQQIENVPVYLGGDGDEVTLTNSAGEYDFVVNEGGNYTITPYSNADPVNGVSTFDAVLIVQHILGTNLLDSPYKLIAGDIDNSQDVAWPDTVDLREVILNISADFPNNTSWRFVDEAFVFPDPTNPWLTAFPESINVNNSSMDLSNLNFIGIKVGDVNLSAIPELTFDPCDISCGHINGKVFFDMEENCLLDVDEQPLENWLITVSGSTTFYAMTNQFGEYSIPVFPGDYTVSVTPINELWQACVASYPVTVNELEEENVDFPIQAVEECPLMVVDLGTPFLRRCFDQNYFVNYCNQGTEAANDAYVEVTFDDYLTVVNSSIPWTSQTGNTYTFDVGNVDVNECGSFYVNVAVSCDAVLGQTHCSEATIFPDENCTTPPMLWDGSSLNVTVTCESDEVRFDITNEGAPMTQAVEFIVIEDHMIICLLYTSPSPRDS